MDDPEFQPEQQELLSPRPGPGLPASVEDLQQMCFDLRTLFNAAMVGLIALALAVNLVIGKQMLVVRHQTEEQRPNFKRAEQEFQLNREPEMRRFVDELLKYAAAHPEFRTAVLDKYRGALSQYFSPAAMSRPLPIPQPAPPAAQPGTSPAARPAGR